ncbi:MAG: tetratricopeptide repeat protein [Ruminococcus sp.]
MKGLAGKIRIFVKNFLDAIIFGTFTGVIFFYIFSVVFGIANRTKLSLISSAGILLVFNCMGIVLALLVTMKRAPHRFDPDLIGDCFTGVGKNARLFRNALKIFEIGNYPEVINRLRAIEERGLSDRELSVIYFYIARSYHIMEYFPNALKYYEMSAEKGMEHDVLKFLTARCTGELGDADKAMELYTAILNDEKSELRGLVRSEIGKMLLSREEPEKALKWIEEAIDLHENYAENLGNAALCCAMLGSEKAEKYYRLAMLNHISEPGAFADYYKNVSESYREKSDTASKE